jgi:hypothetical protein
MSPAGCAGTEKRPVGGQSAQKRLIAVMVMRSVTLAKPPAERLALDHREEYVRDLGVG